MSNCKPGDLARIVHPEMYGKFVDVLYEAPPMGQVFVLPDGVPSAVSVDGFVWVVRAHGAPVEVALSDGTRRACRYGSVADVWLRPIRRLEPESHVAVSDELERVS